MIPTATEITKQLIRLKTLNPPGHEEPAQAYLQELLERAGFQVTRIEAEPGRPNLVTRLAGAGQKPPLLFYAHTDVVGVEGQSWDVPPFDAVEKDGVLYGRGALDMKAGVAMLVHSLLRAAREGVTPAGDIVLMVVVDEEAGGDVGMQHLLANHAALFEGVEHAIGEFGGFPLYFGGRKFYRIGVSQKQYAHLRLRVYAPGGHGSLPASDTVMGRLGAALAKLDAHKMPYHRVPLVRRIIETMADHLDPYDAQTLRDLLEPDRFGAALGRLPTGAAWFESLFRDTANPTIVTAGGKFNVIPSEAFVEVDARILPGRTPDDVVRELQRVVGAHISTEVIAAGPATDAEVDDTLLPLLGALLTEHDPDGIPIPYLFNESPDGRLLEAHGIQNYGFLPMNLPPDIDLPALIHGENERVPVEAIEFGASVLYDLVRRYGEATSD